MKNLQIKLTAGLYFVSSGLIVVLEWVYYFFIEETVPAIGMGYLVLILFLLLGACAQVVGNIFIVVYFKKEEIAWYKFGLYATGPAWFFHIVLSPYLIEYTFRPQGGAYIFDLFFLISHPVTLFLLLTSGALLFLSIYLKYRSKKF